MVMHMLWQIVYLVGIDWWADVVLHKLEWWDYLLRFVTQVLCVKLPQMFVGVFFFFVVAQTGLSTTGYVSLGTSASSIVFLFYQAAQQRYMQRKRAKAALQVATPLPTDAAAGVDGSMIVAVGTAVEMVMTVMDAHSDLPAPDGNAGRHSHHVAAIVADVVVAAVHYFLLQSVTMSLVSQTC